MIKVEQIIEIILFDNSLQNYLRFALKEKNMKYCPKCGQEMAEFCPKCGELQPGFEKEPDPRGEARDSTHKVETASAPSERGAEFDAMSESDKFRYLMEHDEKFKDIYVTSRRKRYFGFVNYLFIIPWIISLALPVGMFTGIKVGSGGEVFKALGYTFPKTFNGFGLISYDKMTGIYALMPGSVNKFGPIMTLVLGLILLVMIGLTTGLGSPKGWYLRTYLTPKGEQDLVKMTKQNIGFMQGLVGIVFSLMGFVTTYVNIANIDYAEAYQRSGGKVYYFGEIAALDSNLVLIIIVSIMFLAMIIVGNVVPTAIVTRKFRDKY